MSSEFGSIRQIEIRKNIKLCFPTFFKNTWSLEIKASFKKKKFHSSLFVDEHDENKFELKFKLGLERGELK